MIFESCSTKDSHENSSALINNLHTQLLLLHLPSNLASICKWFSGKVQIPPSFTLVCFLEMMLIAGYDKWVGFCLEKESKIHNINLHVDCVVEFNYKLEYFTFFIKISRVPWQIYGQYINGRLAWGGGRGGSSFFPRGGGLDPSSTSRVAASRFFWGLFYEPRSGEPIFLAILLAAKRRADFFLAILRAAKRRADFFWLFYEPPKRRADFFWLFWTPVSDVFLASTNAMETIITSLAAQGGGGGV